MHPEAMPIGVLADLLEDALGTPGTNHGGTLATVEEAIGRSGVYALIPETRGLSLGKFLEKLLVELRAVHPLRTLVHRFGKDAFHEFAVRTRWSYVGRSCVVLRVDGWLPVRPCDPHDNADCRRCDIPHTLRTGYGSDDITDKILIRDLTRSWHHCFRRPGDPEDRPAIARRTFESIRFRFGMTTADACREFDKDGCLRLTWPCGCRAVCREGCCEISLAWPCDEHAGSA